MGTAVDFENVMTTDACSRWIRASDCQKKYCSGNAGCLAIGVVASNSSLYFLSQTPDCLIS